ncbi:hypothetical protein BDZ45DRAFT_752627 [Acephala macrosclerotiorum]|nr:hypothetical protein BDZ45DRAFT_752627 [Acephala macrosclerotiorum]
MDITSPLWKNFVYPPWNAAESGPVAELDFTEDDPNALLLLLQIIHFEFAPVKEQNQAQMSFINLPSYATRLLPEAMPPESVEQISSLRLVALEKPLDILYRLIRESPTSKEMHCSRGESEDRNRKACDAIIYGSLACGLELVDPQSTIDLKDIKFSINQDYVLKAISMLKLILCCPIWAILYSAHTVGTWKSSERS